VKTGEHWEFAQWFRNNWMEKECNKDLSPLTKINLKRTENLTIKHNFLNKTWWRI
jgi:hypothetical protein